VFDAYARAIMALADGETPELPLRRFEFLLLQALGYAVDFEYAADDDSPIERPALRLRAGFGFVACERAPDPRTLFLGAHLLAFAEGASDPPLLQAAKRFSRLALQPYLGGASLKSRELFLKTACSWVNRPAALPNTAKCYLGRLR
jgi:DNA repair protein RecO (recombination protein O)